MSILPAHYPIASDSTRALEGLRNKCIDLSELTSLENEIMNSSMEFIDSIIDGDEDPDLEPIKNTLEAFQKLKLNQQETYTFDRVFQRAKGEIRQLSREEPELSIRNIKHYQETIEDVTFSNLISKYTENQTRQETNYENSENYQFLKNCAFIIDHPEEQLPDENEDDDLEIEGGKVDLKCSITLKLFENPMISNKCRHVYDLEGIRSTWLRGQVKKCPTLGCDYNLSVNNFEPDRLMRLRVKAYKKQLEGRRNKEDYERI